MGAKKLTTVAVVSTLATKSAEATHLARSISGKGLKCELVDASIESGGKQLSGSEKIAAMRTASRKAGARIAELAQYTDLRVVVGMGGGTGSQIVAGAFACADLSAWRVLITTQAFDTRTVTGLDGVMIIPAVADIEGLNRITSSVLDGAAAAAAGLAVAPVTRSHESGDRLVAITALGVTSKGVRAAKNLLEAEGLECAVFHANGFGGNTMAAMACKGVFDGIIDYTTHELVSLCLDPETSVAENRFAVMKGCPRVLLPGGVNFITWSRGRSFGSGRQGMPEYSHSPEFTHAGLTADEMAGLGRSLALHLAGTDPPACVVLPMGGFSSEDRPGGALDNPEGREAFAEGLAGEAGGNVDLIVTEGHLNDAGTARIAVDALRDLAGSNMKGLAQ